MLRRLDRGEEERAQFRDALLRLTVKVEQVSVRLAVITAVAAVVGGAAATALQPFVRQVFAASAGGGG